jgi:hypothetical protein
VKGFYITSIPYNVSGLSGGAHTRSPRGTLPLPITVDMFASGLDYNGLRYLLYSEVSEIFNARLGTRLVW